MPICLIYQKISFLKQIFKYRFLNFLLSNAFKNFKDMERGLLLYNTIVTAFKNIINKGWMLTIE